MKVSIVIPVINEQELVGSAIEKAWLAGADEVIIVDGGSDDETAQIANHSNCSFFQTTPGRAKQLNHGAEKSTGTVVLFLHVDNWLEANAVTQIRTGLAEHPDCLAGAFRQRIEAKPRIYRWLESGNARRVKWFNLAYGDQGIFVRKETFTQLGGFPDLNLMEDYVFSQKLRKKARLLLLPGPLHVEARRWIKHGPLRQTFRNWMITMAYRLGVHPNRLANFYRRHDKQK